MGGGTVEDKEGDEHDLESVPVLPKCMLHSKPLNHSFTHTA